MSTRPTHVEQFEDDALGYVHLNLSFASASSAAIVCSLTAEGTTRRQAAADVLRALVTSGYAAVTTEIVLRWIVLSLQEYASDPRGEDSWKREDRSVYLLAAVATLGAATQQGVTSTNAPIDVVNVFRTYKPIPAPCIRSFKSIRFASCTLSETSSQKNSLFPFFHSSCAISVLPIASYAINLSILEAAHSIFGRWRSEMRTDELCTVINFVPAQFTEPFLQALRYTARMLLDSPLSPNKDAETVAQAMVVLLDIFYDLVCQDA